MISQIFLKSVPQNIFFELLDKICIKNNKYYIINKMAYRKGEYLQLLEAFYQQLKSYYHISKQFYITRKQNYSSFITIVRQICKINNINYSSSIIYNKSTYDIIYNIYYEI